MVKTKGIKYSRAKIYKIYSHQDSEMIYIGATTKKYLCQRMESHKANYKAWKNGLKNKLTSFDIFDKYGIENCVIELLENFPCESKDELNAREGYYIKKIECVNRIIPGRTQKEYYKDNFETIKLNQKKYKENNNEKIKKYKNEWNEKNKEKNNNYKRNWENKNIHKVKESRKKNQWKWKVNKQYYCECGSQIRNGEKSRHIKTIKHTEYMNNKPLVLLNRLKQIKEMAKEMGI